MAFLQEGVNFKSPCAYLKRISLVTYRSARCLEAEVVDKYEAHVMSQIKFRKPYCYSDYFKKKTVRKRPKYLRCRYIFYLVYDVSEQSKQR
jgi:hypothetical protein